MDVYGGCGTKRCLRSEFDRCRSLLNKDYKFYLSFENSNCDYYITEKFYENGLRSASLTDCHQSTTIHRPHTEPAPGSQWVMGAVK